MTILALNYMFIALFAIHCSIKSGSGQSIFESSLFSRVDPFCGIFARLLHGCSKPIIITHPPNLLKCTVLCLQDDQCLGVSLTDDVNANCYHHSPCPNVTSPPCTPADVGHQYYSRLDFCGAGSAWNETSQSCSCNEKIYGSRCNSYPKNCAELRGRDLDAGNYWLDADPDQDGLNPVRLYCYVDPGSTRALVFQNTGTFDFNRTWYDYMNGFFYDESNYWMGLRGWHELSTYQTDCTWAVFRVEFDDPSSVYRVRNYKGLVVSSEENNFSFQLNQASWKYDGGFVAGGQKVGECLEPLQNISFSTWDNWNNGDQTENCASINGHGWWFPACNESFNPLGWGFPYRATKPTGQLMSVPGIDFDSLAEDILHTRMYLKNC